MISLIEAVSIEELEYTESCGCENCDHEADWVGFGAHTIFGCPGHGFICEFHRRATLHYAKANEGAIGKCRCGQDRVMSPDEFLWMAL